MSACASGPALVRPQCRHLPDQPVQADRVRGDRRVAFVVVDEREGAQRRDGLSRPSPASAVRSGSPNLSRVLANRNSGIGSGASIAAWRISGSAAG